MELRAELIKEIHSIIENARASAIRSVDFERTRMYWKLGQKIFEEEQGGKDRAEYGKYLIRALSMVLQPRFGAGFSVRQLERYRQFYRMFPIASSLRTQLSWTHYKTLISIEHSDKRDFYIAETEKNNWSTRQLERQINSLLFERLLKSNDIESILAVARDQRFPQNPAEIIKDPMVLEFLGLKRDASYYEHDFEMALITHLQEFLLELGNGFSFVARQKRIHIDGDEFFIDLVFYNRLLQCFVLIELKTEALKHEHLGQLQMYVNYYDRYEKQDLESPTIGILLCTDKNDAVVRISLPESNKTIIASKYQLYLPSETALVAEMRKEIEKLDAKRG